MIKEYDLEAILDCADPVIIAEQLGLETKKCGSKVSILCPNHDDHHFGSCKLTAKGYKCYACGAYGSVFDLVQSVLNVSPKESFAIVADFCGGREHFLLAKDKDKNDDVKKYTRLLNKEELNFIGLNIPPEKQGVYVCKEILYEDEEYEKKQGERIEFIPGNDFKENYKVVMKCVDRNPLLTLAKDYPDEFNELLKNKAVETMEKYASMIACVKQRDVSTVLGYYCNMVAQSCGEKIFEEVCTEKMKKAKSIAVKYGYIEKREKNIFGKIKLGVVL